MYQEYETYVEALVVGKMARAEKDGLFVASGFPGISYDKNQITDTAILANRDKIEDLYVRDNIVNQFKFDQIKYYEGNKDLPADYCVYVSHPGGQAMFYYLVQKILPFEKGTRYQILRLLNSMLLALTFVLFIGWVYRNFGFAPSLVTFFFIFTSSWFVLFSGNGLWWSLWNFFLPFMVMLLLLEKRCNKPQSVSDTKIFVFLFLALVIKFAFSGLEFVTTSLLTPFVPVVYYYWLEKKSFKAFLTYCFKIGLVVTASVVTQFAILFVQLRALLGTFEQAYQYIVDAFVRRASFNNGLNTYDHGERFADSDSLSFLWNNVIKDYLRGDVYFFGFIESYFQFFFAYLIGLVLVFATLVFFLTRNSSDKKYKSLIIATLASVLCPLSWLVIFKEHAFWHPQMDYIIWYMPFLLLGFVVIGVGLSLLGSKLQVALKRKF